MAEFFLSVFGFLSFHLILFLHYLGRHQYTSPLPFPLQLFTNYTTERNYIFLFCNCILAFLIANSAFPPNSPFGGDSSHPTPTPTPTLDEEQHINKKANFTQSTQPPELTAQFQTAYDYEKLSPTSLPAYKHHDDQQQVEDQRHGNITDDLDEREEDEGEGEGEGSYAIGHGDDDEEERIEALMNVDELNKKCEEFIRKMRKQIRN